MGRHALRRGGLAAAVSALAVAVAAVTIYSESGGAAEAAITEAAATTEITLLDPSSATPRPDRPLTAGTTGFLHRQGGDAGLLWTDYDTGNTVTVENASGVYTPVAPCASLGSLCRTAWYGSDGDLVALPTATSVKSVTLWDPATRETSTVTSSYYYRALAGDTVVTGRTLIDSVDGEQRERFVTGDWFTIADQEVVAADSSGVQVADGSSLYYIDVDTAVSTLAFSDVTYNSLYVQNEDRFGWYEPGTGDLHLKFRTDPAGAEQVVDLPNLGELDGDPVLTGDWLLVPTDKPTASAITAVSLTDGSTRTLLGTAGEYAVHAPGDDAFVTGGTSATDWWVRRVSQAADGSLELTKVREIPAAENAKTGLALSRGSLRVAEDDPYSTTSDTTSVRTLTTDTASTLTASGATAGSSVAAACPYAGADCSMVWGNNGYYAEDVYLRTPDDSGNSAGDTLVRVSDGGGVVELEFTTQGGSVVDVSDDYAIYNSGGTTPAQYIGNFNQGQLLKRSVRAAALNGPTLWSATTTAGKITSYSLSEAKTLSTVTIPGAGCVPTELQAAGRWVYWACGPTSAGVYDTKAGTSVATTPGDVLLGDGFAVRHDHTTDELVLTDATTGAARAIASGLPDSGLAVDRRYRWTVDEYTGLVAWFDSYERTHVATTGVTPSAPTMFEGSGDYYLSLKASDTGSRTWHGSWLLSRPITSWSLTFTSVQSGATGKATRTVTGGAATAWLEAAWNGKTANGTYFPNGEFKWTLRATGLGSTTAATVATGMTYVDGGAAVRHDFDSIEGYPDGDGDVLTLSSSGALTYQLGTGGGKFSEKTTGTGWATSIKAVPFGDLSGDRCNDVLVRLSSGALRLYKPGCGAALKPSTSYTTLSASGWNQYDVLTSPGDVSGDGRPDLIARNTSTGAVYLYKGTSTGKLSARVKLYDNWKTYKKIVGTGDLNGDGIGDLIAQDKANNLYRYYGKGNGTFAARVKVFANWGGSYNVIVGAGDLNRDGKADLVSRDTSGNLWRNYGNGAGSFGARTKIATGWGGYKSLS
ncbi:VCBS repeat-containing protein [Streptomyces sp. NBC_00038]|uniref:FG-GAP repeat domain-containing protein n=1 Tax=Streptomyces sp. NBC_00038 TaxID=2903615 RepID=UPI00225808D1|nr:VCBS repeat-containing protein [Streptomyces sp. NBC_00038]MCX5559154.1 VCBS repeat-containing protein [Streptomyces sp. NBC_00038]